MNNIEQSNKPSIVVLASGNGSNFQVLAEKSLSGELIANVRALIVDRACGAIERAKKLGIEVIILSKPWYEDFEKVINDLKPDLVVLAGFMRIIPEHIVAKYFPRIVNIHPSLLPAFPGKDAIKQAYDYGVKVTGITIHFVDAGVDTGPIIFQKAIEIEESWDLETLESKIHELEHENYWRVINNLLQKPHKIEGRKVKWGV
ncbi:phosphoribosylglycinamide formyltransferase [Fervidobacterium pennivorans subsp. shakshaketiis]|jgi:phosphoribosylglycinamide formyltransferase-1|uniref:Phosphoribosylglycinamide formyltransferase n=1 Tax=Fervidobacterium pennivorans (strain DSM 9078 / Ven5) TaxID=771875 RepID=H9UES1_FERPD|nr:phosphoribosylglycinamide formyltransferase [Fervidobacterium pennivorans]AFG36014.1 phosphoribosylglycinamide formyltransferase, formyltetrahydrofolate-dependent [Fervidobacterium pennivorans DSM 9078]QIV79069.1 phosphoribosylglycinamide formyltransferase [Fervidobacterium pennivorans subsp. keratinolyticus]